MTKHEPAATVLRLLGVRPLSRKLGVTAGYVGQWQMSRGNGGLDGMIPPNHREAILDLGREHPEITRELVYMEPKKSGGKYARDKGARHERQVTNLLKERGLDAAKVPLSGAVATHPGDITINHPSVGEVIIQCKSGKALAGYKVINTMMKQIDTCSIRIAGSEETAFIGLSFDAFVNLLQGNFTAPLNWPKVGIKGGTVEKHIEGHDVLIYKMDRQPNRVIVDPHFFHQCRDSIGFKESTR